MQNLKLVWLCCAALFAACAAPKAAENKLPAPAKVEHAQKESDLATVHLTPAAEQRLHIATVALGTSNIARTLDLSGELVQPPGQMMTVTAPLAGTLQTAEGFTPAIGAYVRKGQPLFRLMPFLAPERESDVRTQLERDLAALTERVAAAKLRKERAEALAEEKAGSVRDAERAREELNIAEAELKAARKRLAQRDAQTLNAEQTITINAPLNGLIQQVHTSAGQTLTGGAPLVVIASHAALWVRVPVYVGDLPNVARNQAARVHGLSDAPGAPVRYAKPVAAPPTANAAESTADLYFALSNANGTFRPGERLGVTLALRQTTENLTLPWAAVLHDIQGATWVYEQTAPQTYVRRPVEVRYVTDGLAVLGRAPATGAKIVTTGAFELFGTEFGVGK